jgi:S-adenosyl methyltransferase
VEPVIDTTKPHSARVYDYYLGGKDHFAADRETGQKAMQSWRAVRTAVQENRAFLGRAVRYLAGEAGIRQFLDIGTGLPSANNVHEVAQEVAPESRVVYVDNDPIVLAHARALLTSSPEGRTAYIDADLREPEKILASPAVSETLDLSQPVALMLVAVLHFLVDADNPAAIVATWSPPTSPPSMTPRELAASCAPTGRAASPPRSAPPPSSARWPSPG